MEFENWGMTPYQEALDRQLSRVDEVASQKSSEVIVFCTHPPVVTLGRASQPHDVLDWQGDVVSITRGGKATYHGPNQLLVYPILDLRRETGKRKERDIGQFLRLLELSIVETLNEYDVQAVGKTLQESLKGSEEATGVWIENRKIASIGVAVRKWVTYHGAAINLDFDPNAFRGINPCGFKSNVMISLEEVLKKQIDRAKFIERLQMQCENIFS